MRLLGKAKNLQTIIQTIQFAVPSLINVFALLQIMFFMFAVLGNSMFADISVGDVVDSGFKNFKDVVTVKNGFTPFSFLMIPSKISSLDRFLDLRWIASVII